MFCFGISFVRLCMQVKHSLPFTDLSCVSTKRPSAQVENWSEKYAKLTSHSVSLAVHVNTDIKINAFDT